MRSSPETVVCYDVNSSAPLRCTSCGVRDPQGPFAQPRRIIPDYVAFLVVRGEIFLTDFMPNGDESVRVGPGEIHIIAPGLPQASTVPFAAGIKFLWFHFNFSTEYRLCVRHEAAEIVNSFHTPKSSPNSTRRPQRSWLIPRHLALKEDLNALTAMHGELDDNIKLWGVDDPGSRDICAHMVYALHRSFAQEILRSNSLGRTAPELAHVGRARNFIRLNFAKQISLAEVAAALSLNPSYLSRCFKRVTGETVVEFLMKTRIEASKSLLTSGAHVPPIKEVAYTSGFNSAAYFCRVFRRCEKKTPLDFAKSVRPR